MNKISLCLPQQTYLLYSKSFLDLVRTRIGQTTCADDDAMCVLHTAQIVISDESFSMPVTAQVASHRLKMVSFARLSLELCSPTIYISYGQSKTTCRCSRCVRDWKDARVGRAKLPTRKLPEHQLGAAQEQDIHLGYISDDFQKACINMMVDIPRLPLPRHRPLAMCHP